MSLLKAVTTVGGLTMVSRFFGFVRDILIAQYLGSGVYAEAYVVAFRFPNLFRRIFAEGAFNSAFVPLFAKKLEGEGPEAAKRFADEAFSGLTFVLGILIIFSIAFMPWLMLLIAPGFLDDPAKYDVTVLFTRITMPYLLFLSLVALLGGILNSLRLYIAVGAVPILLNVIMPLALVLLTPVMPSAGHALVWGVALAGVAQFVVMVWACSRTGLMPALRWPRWTPDMKRLVRLGIPGTIAGGATQINLLIGTMIASLQDGAVAWLYYADRLYQLPLSVVGVAMGVVLLPEIARRLRAGEDGAANWNQNRGIEIAMLLTLPATVALIVIPESIVQVLFQRGEFNARDTEAVALVLAAFTTGLPAYVLIKVFSPGYFAREDTATPMRYAIWAMVISTILGIALFVAMGFIGIAIATSVSSWINAGLLVWTLRKRGHYTPDEQLGRRMGATLIASLAMGLALWLGDVALAPWIDGGHLGGFVALLALVVGGMGLFVVLSLMLGAITWDEVRRIFRRNNSA